MRRKPKKSSLAPGLLMAAGGLLLVVALAYLFWPKAQAAPTSTTQPAAQDIPYPEVSRVSAADAYAAQVSNGAVIVDVRGEPYYSESHVAGALSLYIEDLPTRLGDLDPNDWIITYCT